MNKPFLVLWTVLFVLCALPAAGKPPLTDLGIEAPPFDAERVVAQARNRVHSEGAGLVVENASHRAEFSPSGMRYTPRSADGLLADHAFGYRLETVRAGEQAYLMASTQPVAAGANRVEYVRGQGIVEAYLALDTGVEQLFVLNRPLADGALTLVGRIKTALSAVADPAGGLRFLDDGQPVVHYGQAMALDAAGASVMVDVHVRGEELVLVVPGEWLSSAVYPVTVDPFISGDILISRAESAQSYPALAYNQGGNSNRHEWLVVWREERGGDGDIYGQLVDTSGSLQGETIVLWDSDDDLAHPAVTYDSTHNRYFVVWQNMDTRRIEGLMLNADGTIFSLALIQMPSEVAIPFDPRTKADVAYNSFTDEFFVAYEYQTAADNHDIHGCRVAASGAVNPACSIVVSGLAGDELDPAVLADPDDGKYVVVWSREPADNFNIVGRRLKTDGSPDSAVFAISGASGDETVPKLARNSDTGQLLIVWRDSRNDTGDIYGRPILPLGDEFAVRSGADLQDDPAVAYSPTDQQYLVIWNDASGVQGQRLATDLSAVGAVFSVSSSTGLQWHGAVAYGSDRFLSVWTHLLTPYPDIMGQRISGAGELLGNEVGISPALDDQQEPVLAFGTQQRQWLVVWRDFRNGNGDVVGQFVTRDGVLTGEPIGVETHSSHQYEPAVTYNSDNDEFLVVWMDARNVSFDIYGRSVNAATGATGNLIRVTNNPDDQGSPDIAYSESDSRYLVVWLDDRDDPGDNSDQNIYGRRLNADGTAFDASDFVICAREKNQNDVALAYNPVRGQFLVAWLDHSLPDGGIAGQRVRGEDPRLAGPNFDICTETTQQRYPSVASGSASGEYFVAWQDSRHDGFDLNIYGRRVSGTGVLLGTADIAISTAAGNQWRPDVSYDLSTDRYNAFWFDERNGTPDSDIYGQALAANGQLLFTEADANAPAWVYPGEQSNPAAAVDPVDGRGLIVWQDKRNGESVKIYGRLGEPVDLYKTYMPLVLRNN